MRSSPTDKASPAKASRRRRAARRTIAVLPTLFTLGNLLCGFIAIFFASRPANVDLPFNWTPLTFAAMFIYVGMVCDGLDGSIARLTGSMSGLGEQLDSMADMVTFGVAPAFIMVQMIGIGTPFVSEQTDRFFDRVALSVACIYVACAALRLARFNLEKGSDEHADHASFSGLPSPGAAGAVASLALLHQHFLAGDGSALMASWTQWTAFGMLPVTLLVALAMVSRLPYIHVVSRYLRGQARFNSIVAAVIITLLLIVHVQGSFAAAFVIYALSAPAVKLYQLTRNRDKPAAPKQANN